MLYTLILVIFYLQKCLPFTGAGEFKPPSPLRPERGQRQREFGAYSKNVPLSQGNTCFGAKQNLYFLAFKTCGIWENNNSGISSSSPTQIWHKQDLHKQKSC